MLALTRRPGEKLILSGGITIEIVSVRGQEVRIGIDAPLNVRIVREELTDPISTAVADEKRNQAGNHEYQKGE